MKKSHWALVTAAAAGYIWSQSRKKMIWRSFTDRVALIMGGSRGLGLELARQLLKQGARVAIFARDAQELAYARESIAADVNLTAYQGDVTSADDIRRVILSVVEQMGRLDVLINNAGVMRVGPVETMDINDFKIAMDTHYWGTVHATLAALPHMRNQKEGRIVNIASIGGVINPPHLVPYNASKAALIGFSESLSAEVRGNIRIMTVCPGLMRTGSPLNAEFKGNADSEFLWFGLSDMIPGFSISVKRAAEKILDACLRGERELTFTVPAKIGAVMHALFPSTTVNLFNWMNRLLPVSSNRKMKRGREASGVASSILKRELNEVGAQQNQSAGLA